MDLTKTKYNDEYSETVPNLSFSEICDYLKEKHLINFNNIIVVLENIRNEIAVFYDNDMNETKIVFPFSKFFSIENPDSVSSFQFHRAFFNNGRYTSLTSLRDTVCAYIKNEYLSDAGIIQNPRLKLSTDNSVMLLFDFNCKPLGRKITFMLYGEDYIKTKVNYAKLFSDKVIQDFEKEKVYVLLESLWNDHSEVFDLYDSLDDEDKLKLKLTGKLDIQ